MVNALHVWGLAQALGGRVLLRVEDHDRQRCRPEFEAALLDDLDWLGLRPRPAFRPRRSGPDACDGRQSDREAIYRAAAAGLAARGLVYGCRCTRRDLEAAGAGDAGELRYPGTCRRLGLPLEDGLGWRLVVEPTSAVTFDDAVHGPLTQRPAAQCGDLLLRDRLGNWTYQFAVAVDDTAQGIDLVVRGDDLLASTGRQILLARHLGRPAPPLYAHHAAGDEVAGAEAQQARPRHRRARPAGGRLDPGPRARRGGERRRAESRRARPRPRRAGGDFFALVPALALRSNR